MRWAKRLSLALAAVVVVVLVAGSVTGVLAVRGSFPTSDGELTVEGLGDPVDVLRDEHGVPTIVASDSDDLFRAQGFVHAQDRFWEMDFRRHVTAGRVAELFGEDQVDTDRFVRTLGWRRVAEQELDLLEDDTVAMLEAYADGVNAWMDGRTGRRLSLEHSLLPVTGAGGYEPEPWGPVDSIAWLKAMAWDLRANLEDELERGRLQVADLPGERDWRELYPRFDEDRFPPILPDGGELEDGRFVPAGTEAVDTTQRDASTTAPGSQGGQPDPPATLAADSELDATPGPHGEPDATLAADAELDAALAATQRALAVAPELLGDGAADGLGSNSWVLAPERSTTGSALLANDPHLGPSQPSLWYQVGLRCEPVTDACPYHNVGFSFSGVPGIVIGNNASIGWGFTNLGADVADLFVERIDDDRYLTEDGWEPLEQRTETIRVAGGDDVDITVRETRHGPLFSDVSDAADEVADGLVDGVDDGPLEEAGSDAEPADEHAVALRWVALDPANTMDALPRFMRAQDWQAFRDAARDFTVPSQNLVYADVDGHIGYQAPGRIPVRRAGDGTLPVPGWTGEYGWDRYLDFEELPWIVDPDSGYIATANQAVLPDGELPFLTEDPNHGFRAARIVELLEAQERFSPQELLDMQLDERNGNADTLVPFLVDLGAADDDRVVAMQTLLAGWDHVDAADSAGAAAFNATWSHLLANTFHTDLPEFAWPSGNARWWEVVRRLLDDPEAVWWDDPATDTTELRDDQLRAALVDAHDELTERLGDDADDWAWGELHTLELIHGTFGASGIGPVEALFNRGPLEVGGGSDIVNANGWWAPNGYEVIWVPSMRMVLDLGDLDAGRWIHLTGQSGRPFHSHYTDQAERWRDGETIAIAFSSDAAEAAAQDRLRLVPEP